MSRADRVVLKGSQGLSRLAERSAARGGLVARLAQPLAEDAAFLRKLQPSLIKARAKGDAPTDGRPERVPAPRASTRRRALSERNPIPLIGAALGAGVVLARLIDWRGHAHPRD